MGLLSEKGSLGPARQRAFAVTSESRASDIILRFHDCCGNYKVPSSFTLFLFMFYVFMQTKQLVLSKSIFILYGYLLCLPNF